MQAPVVTARKPTAAVPVTLVVLHQPNSTSELAAAKTIFSHCKTSGPAAAKTVSQMTPLSVTIQAKSLLKNAKSVVEHMNPPVESEVTSKKEKSLLKHKIGPPKKNPVNPVILPKKHVSLLKPVIVPKTNTGPATAKNVTEATSRLVSVQAKSLLKKARNSLLRPVITSQDKRAFVRCKSFLPGKTPVDPVLPTGNTSLLKPVIVPGMNSEPASAKTMAQPILRSVTIKNKSILKRAKSMSKCRNSLLNTVITSPETALFLNHVIIPERKAHLKPVTIPLPKTPVNVTIMPNGSNPHIKSLIVQGKDTVRGRKTLQEQPDGLRSFNSRSVDNLETIPKQIVMSVRPAKSLLKPDLPQNNHPKSCASLEDHAYVANHGSTLSGGPRAKTRRKAHCGDFTLDDFKTTQRAKRNLALLKKTLARSKEKLHSRHRKASSSIGKVIELQKLLLELKSKNLVTERGHCQLEKAVNRTLKILKDNFQTDPTA